MDWPRLAEWPVWTTLMPTERKPRTYRGLGSYKRGDRSASQTA